MTIVKFPYGRTHLEMDIPENRLRAVLLSRAHAYRAEASETELVDRALAAPVGTPRLSELARGKKKVVYLASDHTRPVPSRIIFPAMAREVAEAGSELTILVSTGCHRGTTKEELAAKFGPGVVDRHPVVVHDCDRSETRPVGTLPSGAPFRVNRLALEADLLIAEGFIEPHFFAGFSGGRKSVFPGVTDRAGVMANHCSSFIADDKSRTGLLDGNPIHRDMVHAAGAAKLAFICNTVIDADKKVIHAVAGHYDQAHRAGAEFLAGLAGVKAAPADIVVTTNGGFPLDQNLYQAVKGLTAAEATLNPGGLIIMAARCEDGHGGEVFYETFRGEKDPGRLMKTFLSRPPLETVADQWQSQILARILMKHQVVMVTDPTARRLVEDMGLGWAPTLDQALAEADRRLGRRGSITAVPDGIGVIVLPN